MSRKITHNSVKRAVEAVAKGIVEEVASIDFDARGIVQTKRVNVFSAFAESRGKQRHKSVKCKGIGK